MKYYVLFVIILFLLIINSRLVSSCTLYIDGKCCDDNVWPPYCLLSGCCSSGTHYPAGDTHCSICDTTPPTYSSDNDDSGGSVTAGTIVKTTTQWSDDSGLSNAILRYNLTGVWLNASFCDLGASQWCNQTIDTTGISGTICWDQWADDSLDNWNDLMPAHCFDVVGATGNIPPSSETSSSSVESIFDALREEISSSSTEFSLKVVTLSVEFLGIIILVILLVLVIQQVVQSH